MKFLESSIVIISACLVASGQPAEAPVAFDVASIKPADPAGTIAIRRSGYRFEFSSTSLERLVTWAYDVHSDRLYWNPSGGKPNGLDSVRYDIVANAPQESRTVARPGQVSRFQQMMQTLLADRFKLVLHRETRELPMYALVVAKSGPKVHLTEAPGTMGQNPFSMPGRGRLIGTGVSTEMLAKVLSQQLGRSVQDQTGLKGVFDFKLEWEPDTQASAAPAPLGEATGSSLFTAVQEQLGLKLEARKGPVEVLIIDHLESTPTEN